MFPSSKSCTCSPPTAGLICPINYPRFSPCSLSCNVTSLCNSITNFPTCLASKFTACVGASKGQSQFVACIEQAPYDALVQHGISTGFNCLYVVLCLRPFTIYIFGANSARVSGHCFKSSSPSVWSPRHLVTSGHDDRNNKSRCPTMHIGIVLQMRDQDPLGVNVITVSFEVRTQLAPSYIPCIPYLIHGSASLPHDNRR